MDLTVKFNSAILLGLLIKIAVGVSPIVGDFQIRKSDGSNRIFLVRTR